ncbi:uncharacterized protein LOC123295755 isoform X2 [Chrysoperla carnea]|uniref:uncharacterized protein LOC123295755 isoform X2 n=1 Tax=Chrysoperla carnea TaxID=189513 RepID=UPI001D07FE3A|nr:uncharacterized protein LOC123295755 isoform X2 [Chrysoperla carnea]
MEPQESRSVQHTLHRKMSQTQICSGTNLISRPDINCQSNSTVTGMFVAVDGEEELKNFRLNATSILNMSKSAPQTTYKISETAVNNSDTISTSTAYDTFSTSSNIKNNTEELSNDTLGNSTDTDRTSSVETVVFSSETSNAAVRSNEDILKQFNLIRMTHYILMYSTLQRVSSAMYSPNKIQETTIIYSDIVSHEAEMMPSKSWINVCRICYGTESYEALIGPCKCRGSIAFAHHSCLERWLRESSRSRCELCRFKYQIIRTPKYSMLRGILIWIFVPAEHSKELYSDILGFCLYTPAALLATYLLLVSCESVRQIMMIRKSFVGNLMAFIAITGMASIDFAYSTWLILRFRKHMESWHRWWSNNCHLTLVIPPQDGHFTSLLGKSIETFIANR